MRSTSAWSTVHGMPRPRNASNSNTDATQRIHLGNSIHCVDTEIAFWICFSDSIPGSVTPATRIVTG